MSERKWLGKIQVTEFGTEFVEFDDADECLVYLKSYQSKLLKGRLGIIPLACNAYLTRPQVRALIRHLQTWLDTGRLR